MENITALNHNFYNLLPLLSNGYGEADFETKTTNLYYNATDHDRIQSSKIAIYREDTFQLLGVVGSRYKVVTHKQMIDNQRKILGRSDLNCEGIEETITIGGDGSKCFVRHVLPAHTITTPDGDTAVLSFLGTNSYDSTFSFLLSGGARQNACMNGQVWTKGAATIYKAKHSYQLNIEHAARVVGESLKMLTEQNNLWHMLANQLCSYHQALLIFSSVTPVEEKELHDVSSITNKDFNYLLDRWEFYRNQLGNNKWALYNTLTDWSTHAPAHRKGSSIANIQRKREALVQGVITKLAA